MGGGNLALTWRRLSTNDSNPLRTAAQHANGDISVSFCWTVRLRNVRVRSLSAENALSKRLERANLRVRVADGSKYPRPGSGYLVLRRVSEEGRKCCEIWNFILFGESAPPIEIDILRTVQSVNRTDPELIFVGYPGTRITK